MNWQDLGGALIRAGAPVIGKALGGPLGGMIGEAVGGVVADTLGTEATPEAVDTALKTTPAGELQDKLAAADSEAAARFQALAAIGQADADAAARSLAETHATMRTEAASDDVVQRWWRPIYALELVLECVGVWVIAFTDLMSGGQHVASFVLSSQGLLQTYWMARFGVLGVYVGGRTVEKVAGAAAGTIGGQKLPPAVIDQIVKAVKKR